MTTSEPPAPYWGSILKSNSNGTYYGVSIDNVNRDDRGYVDFEKMIGLDGIAMVNVVANPLDAPLSGRKLLQTKITHNDGGSWNALNPPKYDSLGNQYECKAAVIPSLRPVILLSDLLSPELCPQCSRLY